MIYLWLPLGGVVNIYGVNCIFSPLNIGSILVLQILKCNNLVPLSNFCPFITCIFGPLKYGVGLILVPEVGF